MPDVILNDKIVLSTQPQDVQKAFIRGFAEPKLFPAGYRLYKYTSYGLFSPSGGVTSWWFSVDPVVPGDTGLAGLRQSADNLGVASNQYARARAAVDQGWGNGMRGVLIARLLVPAWGLVGRCSAQNVDSKDASLSNVVYIGGAYQLYIPGLSAASIAQVVQSVA